MDAHLRNSENFAANGGVQSPMDLMLNGPSILSDSDDPQSVVVSGRRFDPTRDSLMRDGSKGYAVTGKSWDDGSSVVTFANGIEYTDNNGNVAFDVRDTSKTILSGKDYEQSVARVQYLDQKYDPQNGWDQFKNYFTGKLDDSNYVLSDRDRVERETLHQINSISVDAAAHPDKYDTRWASIDAMRSSILGAVAETANLKYVQPKYQQDVRQLMQSANGLAMAGSGLRQQYAFLGNVKAPGSPLLQPQNSSMVINQSQSIRTDRIVVGTNRAERYGGLSQRQTLLNQISETSSLSEAKGVAYAFREMKNSQDTHLNE